MFRYFACRDSSLVRRTHSRVSPNAPIPFSTRHPQKDGLILEQATLAQTRRKHRRYDVDFTALARVTEAEPDIDAEMLSPAPVQITNLCFGGMHLRAKLPFPVDAEVLIDWQLDGKTVSAVGRIRYRMTEFSGGKPLYGCGVKFDNDDLMRRALPVIVGESD